MPQDAPITSGRTEWLSELLKALRPSVETSKFPARFLKIWIYDGRVAVVDFLIYGKELAFDISLPGDETHFRVEMISRRREDDRSLMAMGFKKISGNRVLIGETPADQSQKEIVDSVALLITAAVDKAVTFGPNVEDTKLFDCLQLHEPIIVADVGANPLTPPPYSKLIDLKLCHVVGFEPQKEAFEKLQAQKLDHESYFPHAIGAPGEIDLNIYQGSGFTSSYKIDQRTIDLLGDRSWTRLSQLERTVRIECSALDAVPDLPCIDLLKIDIQGGELDVFRNARRSLSTALCVITEVSFFPLYEDAPSFAEVHQELVEQGFFLHKFMFLKSMNLKSLYAQSPTALRPRNQLIDGDAVYLRDIRNLNALTTRDLKVMALLGHLVFSSRDLVLRILEELESRDEITGLSAQQYADSINSH